MRSIQSEIDYRKLLFFARLILKEHGNLVSELFRIISVILGPPLAHYYALIIFIIELLDYQARCLLFIKKLIER